MAPRRFLQKPLLHTHLVLGVFPECFRRTAWWSCCKPRPAELTPAYLTSHDYSLSSPPQVNASPDIRGEDDGDTEHPVLSLFTRMYRYAKALECVDGGRGDRVSNTTGEGLGAVVLCNPDGALAVMEGSAASMRSLLFLEMEHALLLSFPAHSS